jgi:hypothetical protein
VEKQRLYALCLHHGESRLDEITKWIDDIHQLGVRSVAFEALPKDVPIPGDETLEKGIEHAEKKGMKVVRIDSKVNWLAQRAAQLAEDFAEDPRHKEKIRAKYANAKVSPSAKPGENITIEIAQQALEQDTPNPRERKLRLLFGRSRAFSNRMKVGGVEAFAGGAIHGINWRELRPDADVHLSFAFGDEMRQIAFKKASMCSVANAVKTGGVDWKIVQTYTEWNAEPPTPLPKPSLWQKVKSHASILYAKLARLLKR